MTTYIPEKRVDMADGNSGSSGGGCGGEAKGSRTSSVTGSYARRRGCCSCSSCCSKARSAGCLPGDKMRMAPNVALAGLRDEEGRRLAFGSFAVSSWEKGRAVSH